MTDVPAASAAEMESAIAFPVADNMNYASSIKRALHDQVVYTERNPEPIFVVLMTVLAVLGLFVVYYFLNILYNHHMKGHLDGTTLQLQS